MAGINNRDVNEETLNIAPFPNLPSNGSGNANNERVPQSTNGNQVPHAEGQGVDTNMAMDPKTLKRAAASRLYSQRYRLKQINYIAQLEAKARALEAEVVAAYPKIRDADAQSSLLRAENGSMKEKLSVLSGEIMLKEAKYHELKKEKDALKQLSLMHLSPAFAESSQPNHYGYPPVNNMAMDQPGFNQFVGAVAPPPMMQNQNTENEFGFDVNFGDNYNPM
ncbi:hypothetical protein ES319_D08G240400v1 [Gossypium barbadense]|uniref:BZIP domain-containing protein n=1 Tax=Gossypium barbadense TaxID=3634 RepID=A0A5J5QIA1_GOSBA|nr:hypothetical protein ES319_D08G240400v1 [Gossypium barbadense]